jgi:nicotinamide phosphoribosyltransferase
MEGIMNIFPLHATDFYKCGHVRQYSPGTEFVYSNFTCRGDRWANTLPDFDHKAVLFGLQGVCQWLLIKHWNDFFFHEEKDYVVNRYTRRMATSLGDTAFNADHIAALHDLGYLPVLIKALPEGSRVDMRVPLWTIQNTLPEFYWVTNYLETQLSSELWKVLTSATTAFEYRVLFERYAELTGSAKEFVPWQAHDFSMRGLSGIHDATQSGAGHLLSFTGTDTVSAIDYLEDYYDGMETFVGGSVPASEHSVMCMGGKDDEIKTFLRLITEVYPSGIVSIVADSWDFWKVITSYARDIRGDIMARNGKVVFRPDSGDPVKILVGDPEAPNDSPAFKGAVECLWNVFGGETTSTGHRLLDGHVGLIYGDSITLDRAQRILAGLAAKGFSSGNVVFGVGSFTYQLVTRDSYGTAIKATFGVVNGEDRELFKDPVTDNGIKKSARGLLRVEQEGGRFVLHDRQTREEESRGLLQPVFRDGQMVRMESLATIRERLMQGLAARVGATPTLEKAA